MKSTRTIRALTTGLLLVVFAVGWRSFGPVQLGGSASYLITHGNSMEPRYHQGDLVILKNAENYEKGDIVGYESPSLGRTVLHRIHSFDSTGSFLTKGDNNSWVDSDRLTDADVLGRATFDLPGAGHWLLKVRSPAGASILVGLVALMLAFGKEKKKRRSRQGTDRKMPRIALGSFTQQQKMAMGGVTAVCTVALLLAIFSFRQPLLAAVSADAAYEHVGNFSYSAEVQKNPVYPSGQVEPGQPVFLRLVDEMKVSFDYALNTETGHSVQGEALMFARVRGATGWKKKIPLADVKTFRGHKVHLEGALSFKMIRGLSEDVQAITGLPESGQTVELVAKVDLKGQVAGEEVAEQFAPTASFQMDTLQLQVTNGEGRPLLGEDATSALRQKQPGAVSVDETTANNLELLGASLGIRFVRQLSLLALIIGLTALGLLWRRFSNPAHADEASLIAGQYGDWLIPVEAMPTQAGHKAVQVKSMEALVRLAELYERMILHEDAPRGHTYFVEEEGVMYYYRPQMAQTESDPSPSTTPRFGNRKSREERRRDEVERLRSELSQIEAEVLREEARPSEE